MDRRFGAKLRIKRRGEFARVFSHGRRASDRVITLLALRRQGQPFCRLGVAVATRFGPAVQRNRVKRLCREAFRLTRPHLPAGWDFIVLPRPRADARLPDFQASLVRLARRLTEGTREP